MGVALSAVWKLIVLGFTVWLDWNVVQRQRNNMQVRAFALSSAILYANRSSNFKMYSSLSSKYCGVLLPYLCNCTWLLNEQVWSWVYSMNASRALQLFAPWLMLSQAEPWTHCCSSKPNPGRCGVDWLNQTQGSVLVSHYGPRTHILPWWGLCTCILWFDLWAIPKVPGSCSPHGHLVLHVRRAMPVELTQNSLCLGRFPTGSLQEKDFGINLDSGWHVEVKYLPCIPTTAYCSAHSCTFYLGFGEI